MQLMNVFSDAKDYLTDRFTDFSDAIDLEDKVALYKRKFVKARYDLDRGIEQLKRKRLGEVFTFGRKPVEKKTNPIIALFCVLGGLLLAFSMLVAFFYGVFVILDKKKKDGYFTVKF